MSISSGLISGGVDAVDSVQSGGGVASSNSKYGLVTSAIVSCVLALLLGVTVSLSFPETADDVLNPFLSPPPRVSGSFGGVACGVRVVVEQDPTEEPSRAFLLGVVGLYLPMPSMAR